MYCCAITPVKNGLNLAWLPLEIAHFEPNARRNLQNSPVNPECTSHTRVLSRILVNGHTPCCFIMMTSSEGVEESVEAVGLTKNRSGTLRPKPVEDDAELSRVIRVMPLPLDGSRVIRLISATARASAACVQNLPRCDEIRYV